MKNLKQHILEKLKVKHNISKMTLTEFNKTRKSLNRKENDFKLVSQYDMKDMFINWVEHMLIEDGVIDEIPFGGFMKHIIRFDGDILIDNIIDAEIDPPVSTEMYLTWGEAYMRVVTYYVKYDIFDDDCNLIYEKLKVSTNTDKNDSTEVLFGKFISYLCNKPGKQYKNLVPEDLYYGLNIGPIESIYLPKYFKNSWNELYNFFGRYVDDIVEISYRYDTDRLKHIYYCWEIGDKYFEDGPYESTLEELAKTTKFKDIKNAINDFIVKL